MSNSRIFLDNNRGFILVITMLILVVLTLIGLSATRTTNIELQVAGNEKWSQESFYQADGASEATIMVIEESIFNGGLDQNIYWNSFVNNLNFYMKEHQELFVNQIEAQGLDWSITPVSPPDPDTGTGVDLYLPRSSGGTTKPFSQLKAGGVSQFTPGSALNMASGYEGFGQSSAQGGGQVLYDVWSNHQGRLNSTTMLRVQWRHVN